jgi:hypothetical protein
MLLRDLRPHDVERELRRGLLLVGSVWGGGKGKVRLVVGDELVDDSRTDEEVEFGLGRASWRRKEEERVRSG